MLNKLKSYYEYNKEQIEYVISKLDIAILILYGLFVFEAFLRSTTFEINWHPYYHMSLKVILILLAFGKSLLKFIDNIPLYMLLGFCSVGFLLAYLQGNHGILLELILFTIAFVDIDYKNLITIFTAILSLSLLIIVTGSQVGILNNLVYTTYEGVTRISFGVHYPTNFASYILFLCLAWGFNRKQKISYIELFIMFTFAYTIHHFCAARTSSLCLTTFSCILFLYKITQNNSVKKLFSHLFYKILLYPIVFAVVLSSIISIGLSYAWTPNNNFLFKINQMISGRLLLSKEIFNNYDIKLLGQHIEMRGNGGYSLFWVYNESMDNPNYNFIDSSYLSILFRYGLFVFICVIALFTLTSFVARKHHDYITLIIIAIIAVHSIMEHHLLDFNYNPFMFLLISSYYGKHNSKNKLNKSDITTSKKLLQDDLDVITTSNKEVQA